MLRNYFEHLHTNSNKWRKGADSGQGRVYEDLSRHLRREVVLHTECALLERVPWLRSKPRAFVGDALVLLEPSVALPGQLLQRRGQTPLEVQGGEG